VGRGIAGDSSNEYLLLAGSPACPHFSRAKPVPEISTLTKLGCGAVKVGCCEEWAALQTRDSNSAFFTECSVPN
jgi:hypothetical protein